MEKALGKLRPLSLPKRFRIALKVPQHQSREARNLSDGCKQRCWFPGPICFHALLSPSLVSGGRGCVFMVFASLAPDTALDTQEASRKVC